MYSINLKQRLISNSFLSMALAVISRIGTLLFTIFVTRLLLPEGYGQYILVFSIGMVFLTFADLGLNQCIIRYFSFCLRRNRSPRGYYFYFLKLKLILGGIIFFTMILSAPFFSNKIFENSNLLLPIVLVSFYTFIYSLEGFYANLFYSFEDLKHLLKREFLTQFFKILSLFLVVYLLPLRFHVSFVFLALIIITLFTFLFNFFKVQVYLRASFNKILLPINKKEVKKFIFFFALASISLVLFSNMDGLILGHYSDSENVGLYKAAYSLILGIVGILSFPNMLFLSVFTKIKGKMVKKVLNNAFKYLSILALPATFGLILLGKYFIKIFFGSEYLSSSVVLYILAPIIFPAGIVGLIVYLFAANEKTGLFAKSIISTTILNVSLNLILIKHLSGISSSAAVIGAAAIGLLSWIFYSFYASLLLKRELNLDLNFKPLVKIILSCIIMSLLVLFFLNLFKDITLINGAIIALLAAAAYFFSCYLLGVISKKDFVLLIENSPLKIRKDILIKMKIFSYVNEARKRILRRKIYKDIKKLNPRRILDNGAGLHGSFDYMEFKNRVTRCDISTNNINSEKLPFKSESFDCIVFAGVIQYLNNPNKALKECCRVLKNGGSLIISTINRDCLVKKITGFKEEKNSWRPDQFKRLLEKNNFNVLNSGLIDFWFIPKVWNMIIYYACRATKKGL